MGKAAQLVDDRERAVVGFWQKRHLSAGTIQLYLQWIRRFRKFCEKRNLVQTEQLTLNGALRFARAYSGPRLCRRRSTPSTCNVARNALHAWACALRGLGVSVPNWREKDSGRQLSPLMEEYCQYRRVHNGIAEATLYRDVVPAGGFLAQLQRPPAKETHHLFLRMSMH